MLETTQYKLATMYEKHPQRGSDGLLHELDDITKISIEQGHLLAQLHATVKPKLSIEIGLAYGYSTLFILDAAFQTNAGRHIAIDPFQDTMWHGIGRQAVKELDFESRFEHIPETSVAALTGLCQQGVKADYIYIDGAHTFDYALVDFFCSDRVLNLGGILIFDDCGCRRFRRWRRSSAPTSAATRSFRPRSKTYSARRKPKKMTEPGTISPRSEQKRAFNSRAERTLAG